MKRTLIALAIAAESTREALLAMERHVSLVDVAELRVDLMHECDLREIMKSKPLPLIVTNRPTREGGRFSGEERLRLKTLREAIELGAEYVDCEADSFPEFGKSRVTETKFIVSRHDFGKMPNLFEVLESIKVMMPDIAKVVGMAKSSLDALHALEVLKRTNRHVISLAMGRKGLPSRVLATRYGAYLTFVSQNSPDKGTAPGQLSASAMRETYLAHLVDAETTVLSYLLPEEVIEIKEIAEANHFLRSNAENAVVIPFEMHESEVGKVFDASDSLGINLFLVHPRSVQAVASFLGQPLPRSMNTGLVVVRKPEDCRTYSLTDFSLLTAVQTLDSVVSY
ncbi:MAG TPA: type I 3-dehydroquinate dehydratase [Candidatus Hydrogenedentes bacterium]|nr:type I 3-dehydroquinate dehydratase [Candidatus Hydrogenedentota bacterium]HOL75566.1 type I 3-dehydroquinate dehydratase [Candidatus Hydrogenedentota bacterium]HPO87009.1 type I 3-dehydroquinate dehydratase [Candidatus Hydrogenedentota bacterium]